MSRYHDRHGLSGRRWRRLRRAALDRDGWRCQSCGRAGRLEADHVVPLERGGEPWDPENLQTLCRTCHIAKTSAERRPGRQSSPAVQRWVDLVADLSDE